MRKMHKKVSNNYENSFDQTRYVNNTSSHLSASTVDIKEVCINNSESSCKIDTAESTFIIKGIENGSTFENIKIKEEPSYSDAEEEYPIDNLADQYNSNLLTNTIIKEEIIIECEPDVNGAETTDSSTESTFTSEKRQLPSGRRRQKVYKNWQEHQTFALESDALELVRKEQIWTKYTTNRTDKWKKVIYRCRNVKSRGQQCEAGIYLMYSHVDPSVTLFRSINLHTCHSIESKRKRPFKLDSNVTANEETQLENNENKIDTDDNYNSTSQRRRRKIVRNWQKEKSFQFEDDALAAVKSEQTWAKYTTNKTDKGNKAIYRCRNVQSRGLQCEAGVYLLYSLVDPTIMLYRSINKHTCDKIETKSKQYVRRKNKKKTKTEPNKVIKNDENQQKLQRRKKVIKNWRIEKSFISETEALHAVKSEHIWTKYTTNKTDKGNKVIYRCRNVKSKGQQCDAGVYLLYALDGTVTMYRSANKHTCDIIESKSKLTTTLTDEAKSIIKTEYEKGLKPKLILAMVLAKGLSCSQIQINNYLAQLRRDAYQSTVLTLKENTFEKLNKRIKVEKIDQF